MTKTLLNITIEHAQLRKFQNFIGKNVKLEQSSKISYYFRRYNNFQTSYFSEILQT